jgi:N utilization substance protein A
MKAIDNKELVIAMEELEKERGIEKTYLLQSIEDALVIAYKKNFDSAENVKVVMEGTTGQIHVYSQKEVVEEVEDDYLQISEADAKKYEKKAVVGDIINIEIVPKDFGRIAAQTAKQVIMQKIREVERNMVFSEYNDRKGEIVSGIIQKADGGTVVLDLGKLEGIMPLKEQISTENYRVNDKLKAYVVSVEKGLKGIPQVLVSRNHPDFVRKLFELEVPEIASGEIVIKNIVREAGYRTKMSVYSSNKSLDCIGACVGNKGMRVNEIVNELNGEKIDIVPYSEDAGEYIVSALSPATVLYIHTNIEDKSSLAVVPDDKLSLAIGKSGQNVRLAAKLTGWKIDVKAKSAVPSLNLEEDNKNNSNYDDLFDGEDAFDDIN